MSNYASRVADGILAEKLAGKGAVLIEGAKWCGKTTTAEQIAKSVGDGDFAYRRSDGVIVCPISALKM